MGAPQGHYAPRTASYDLARRRTYPLIYLLRGNVIGLFIHDPAVVDLGMQFMTYMLILCPFIGIYYLSSNFLKASGNAIGASIASALRQGILLIPLLYIMNSLMGMFGLAAAHRVADFFAIVITAGMAFHYYHRITNVTPIKKGELRL